MNYSASDRSAPTTTDYVQFHALHRPRDVAIICDGRAVTYELFYPQVKQMTLALHALGLRERMTVAVTSYDLALHWLLLLACENLGVVTCSFLRREGQQLAPLFKLVDFILADQPMAEIGSKSHFIMTNEWLAQLQNPQPDDRQFEAVAVEASLDEPQRIRRSSGSTGGQKLMYSTRRDLEYRMRTRIEGLGVNRHTRFLLTSTFAVGSMYSRATGCLRMGGTCILDGRLSIAAAIQHYKVTHVRLYQGALGRLLDELPADFVKPPGLTLLLGAAPLSRQLWDKTLERLASEIAYTYSSNETGSICAMNEDGLGTLRPGVIVQIVDEAGTVLPHGESGIVRIKTPSMVDGYIGDEAMTASNFRDGWVYPGDAGVMPGPRQLRLIGRVDELLNLGGIKYSAPEYEDVVRRIAPVQDVAITTLRNSQGIEEMAIAFVSADSSKAKETMARIEKGMPPELRPLHLRWVSKIERTETGKLRRQALRALFEEKKPG